jgi:hypothetical protein
MYSLKTGAKKLNYSIAIPLPDLQNLQEKYAHSKITKEEAFWQYYDWSITKPLEKISSKKTLEDIWKKLTKPQKIMYSLGAFISQVNNGGVWQFMFNKIEFTGAAGEALEELNVYSSNEYIKHDYRKAFKELITILNNGIFTEILDQWNDEKKPFEERWDAFKKGYEHIPMGRAIEKYFYKDDYKIIFYDKLIAYIEKNLGFLVEFESNTDTAKKQVIDKNNAISHFTTYLKEYYNQEPISVAIYYTAKVSIESQAVNLFLMQFSMPDGYQSIGITGYFTMHLPLVDMAEIKKMYQKFHKQELVNIYYGGYLVEEEKKKNPKATVLNQKTWDERLAKIQNPKNTQIPVNVKVLEYFKYGKDEWFIYEGDLMYNDKKDDFPQDLNNVKVQWSGKEKKGEYTGETDCVFFTKGNTFGGRSRTNAPVTGKYRIYDIIGSQNKLLKDNAWGF